MATLKGGMTQFEVMSKADVDAIRSVSKSKDNGPWVTNYPEMARKTVLRRLVKYLPMAIELPQEDDFESIKEVHDVQD